MVGEDSSPEREHKNPRNTPSSPSPEALTISCPQQCTVHCKLCWPVAPTGVLLPNSEPQRMHKVSSHTNDVIDIYARKKSINCEVYLKHYFYLKTNRYIIEPNTLFSFPFAERARDFKDTSQRNLTELRTLARKGSLSFRLSAFCVLQCKCTRSTALQHYHVKLKKHKHQDLHSHLYADSLESGSQSVVCGPLVVSETLSRVLKIKTFIRILKMFSALLTLLTFVMMIQKR